MTCGKNLQDSRELSFNFQNIPDAATDEGSTYNSSVTSLVPYLIHQFFLSFLVSLTDCHLASSWKFYKRNFLREK